MATPQINIQDIKKFIAFIKSNYQNEMHYEFKLMDRENKTVKKQFFFKKEKQINDFLEKEDGIIADYNFYMGLLPRDKSSGKRADISVGNVIFIDLDSEIAISEYKIILEKLTNFGIRPSMTNKSGHGIHLLWKIDCELAIQRRQIIEKAMINFFRENFQEYNPDCVIFNETRLIRVAGSVNQKVGKDPVLVEILDDFLGDYREKDLLKVLNNNIEKETIKQIIPRSENKLPINKDIEELINKGASSGKRHLSEYIITNELWNSGWSKEDIITEVLKFNKNCSESKPDDVVIKHIDYLIENHSRFLIKEIYEDKDIMKAPVGVSEEEVKKELTIDELKDILGKTIMADECNKLICFFNMLCAYTEDSQFNISFRAPSSSGKSYIALELSNLFPRKDVMELAYASPSAFWHDTGTFDPVEKKIKIDLCKKIMIFLDMPHDMLLQKLRPLLSHDRKELLVKITDKNEKGGSRTKNVIVKGFPSVIFCSGNLLMDEQEATRSFILSPETTQEKLRAGIVLKVKKEGDKEAFKEWINDDIRRETLKYRIQQIKLENIKEVKVLDTSPILDWFLKRSLKPRDARDVERLFSIIRSIAILNCWTRERNGGIIYASEKDISDGIEIWNSISEAQEVGVPPYILRVYQEIIQPYANNGIRKIDIMSKHYKLYGRPLSKTVLEKQIIPTLESVGLISEEKDKTDGKTKLIYNTEPYKTTDKSYIINDLVVESKKNESLKVTIGSDDMYVNKEVKSNIQSDVCDICGREADDLEQIIDKYSENNAVIKVCLDCKGEVDPQ